MAQYADYFVIPMFSKAYPTPWYWETIARGYKSFLKKPMFVNFYVRGPNETWDTVAPRRQIMTVATRVARQGVDGIIFLAEKAEWIPEFQKRCRRRQRKAQRAQRLQRRRSLRPLQPLGKNSLNPKSFFPFINV